MTKIQKRILELFDEIVSICEKENLKYIVANESARYVLDHKKFADDQCYFKISMPLSDIDKLEKYVSKNLSDTREIESWRNNYRLQHFKFRYCDKTSLLFDGGSSEFKKSYGISITINPMREFEPSDEVRGSERFLVLDNFKQASQAKWIVFYKLISRITGIKRFKSHIMRKVKLENANYLHQGMMKAKKMTREELAKYIVDENVNATKPYTSNRFIPEEKRLADPTLRENCFAYMDGKANVIKFPLDLFTRVKTTEFEGRQMKVYEDEELYFSQLYGNNWQTKQSFEIGGSDRAVVIWDVDTPYQEFLDCVSGDGYSILDLVDYKMDYNRWMGRVYNPTVNPAVKTFNQARRSVDRIDIWYKLRNKYDALRKAYENDDIKKLKSLMKPYLSASDRYYDDKIGFYIDEELFKYATKIWENEGRPSSFDSEGNEITYAMKVLRLVPEIYLKESPEQYLRSTGVPIFD
ncbi:MAG: LicD family protein [Ruminococcus sp.]|nr:LicD family protein [Ruminococcus sp.]